MHTKDEQHKLIRYLKSKPKHGDTVDLANYLLEIPRVTTKFISSVTAASDGAVQAAAGIDKLIGSNEALLNTYKDITKESLKLELRNKIINDQFGVTTKVATQLAISFNTVANKLKISDHLMKQYGANIQKIVPTLNQIKAAGKPQYESLVAVQRVLMTNLKLSAQSAEEYSYYATQNGKSADEALRVNEELTNLLDPSGTMGLFKIATVGIAKAGATIQLQYGKIPGNLEMAVIKANMLGLEMKELQAVSDKLLNIEGSIGDELEYQLLSGRRLVGDEKAKEELQGKSLTNAYRMAALQRDGNKQADILNTILTQEGSQLENNLLARQQMSKLLGIDEMQLSRAIQKKKILEEEGAEILFNLNGKDLINQARELVSQKKMTEKGFAALMEMNDTRTSDETLNEILDVNKQEALSGLLTTQLLSTMVSQTSKAVLDNGKTIDLIKFVKEQAVQVGAALYIKRLAEKGNPGTLTTKMNESTAEPVVENESVERDALIMNDGVVKFHAQDKFMRVNDSTMIAGTNVDGNRQLAKSINGANSAMTSAQISQLIQAFTAVGDMMARAIESQTSALKRDSLFAPGINRGTWD